MATRIDRSAGAAAAAPRPSADTANAARELGILHPNRELVIGDRIVVVREYGFVEGLGVHAMAKPFIEALYAQIGLGGAVPTFSQIEALLVDNQDSVLALITKAADVDLQWISGISDEDGYRLMQEWWLANSGFFIRRVMQRLATDRALARQAGPASTPPSSAPATDPPQPTSADSPRDS